MFVLENGSTPFVHIKEYVLDVCEEIVFSTANNLTGKKLDGYLVSKAILTPEATRAICKVQEKLRQYSFCLKIYDAYRPAKAVQCLKKWAYETENQKNKLMYYPNVDKSELISKGYIADKSSHSRGSTVDLTIINLKTGEEIDMGSRIGLLCAKSNISYQNLSRHQKRNREFLIHIMKYHGFIPYEKEWWHYTLKNEPYPDTYFNIDIR